MWSAFTLRFTQPFRGLELMGRGHFALQGDSTPSSLTHAGGSSKRSTLRKRISWCSFKRTGDRVMRRD